MNNDTEKDTNASYNCKIISAKKMNEFLKYVNNNITINNNIFINETPVKDFGFVRGEDSFHLMDFMNGTNLSMNKTLLLISNYFNIDAKNCFYDSSRKTFIVII